MRYLILVLFVSVVTITSSVWAANCERCYVQIDKDSTLCEECSLTMDNDLTNMASREELLINTITAAREEYKSSLDELVQLYLSIGYQLRLEKARNELKALNKVPRLKYMTAKKKAVNISPSRDIEEANILYQDGIAYKNSLNLLNKTGRLTTAAARFLRILDLYPESDRADDAAFELADIYESLYFKDYEGAAYYYVECYTLNPDTERPARYMAARIYDMFLKDYEEAIRHYKMALSTCRVEDYLEITKTRINDLGHQGY